MFAIYDLQGCSFRNTLEHLRKVKKSSAPQRATLLPRGEEAGNQNLSDGHSALTRAHVRLSL